MGEFTAAQWQSILSALDANEAGYGMPERRSGSLVLASFNIRKFGKLVSRGKPSRSAGAWDLFERFASRCDLLAVQEVMQDMSSIKHLVERLGSKYTLAISDASGAMPGRRGVIERLAFVYRNDRIKPTGLSSDIGLERSDILDLLLKERDAIWEDLEIRQGQLEKHEDDQLTLPDRLHHWQTVDFPKWQQAMADWQASGQVGDEPKKPKKPSKPRLPRFAISKFLQFIRTPHMVSFEIPGTGGAAPYHFLAVNAHLLFAGKTKAEKAERAREFAALMAWLRMRAINIRLLYAPNIILLGDLNFGFQDETEARDAIEDWLKTINKTDLKHKLAKMNMPFLDAHPDTGKIIRTNSRKDETFDHIAIVATDDRLPPANRNDESGKTPDGYAWGMFDFVKLFRDAVPALIKPNGKIDYSLFQHDVSDHMPIWIRLERPNPGQPVFQWR